MSIPIETTPSTRRTSVGASCSWKQVPLVREAVAMPAAGSRTWSAPHENWEKIAAALQTEMKEFGGRKVPRTYRFIKELLDGGVGQ